MDNKSLLSYLITAFFCIFVSVANAQPIIYSIDFESDMMGYKSNGFTSVGVPDVHFTDTNGAELLVANFGSQGDGKSLGVYDDFEDSGLQINLDFLSDAMSFSFGNDDPLFSSRGDKISLTLFRDGRQVGFAEETMNRDDVMNQILSLNGIVFNSALIKYEVDPNEGLVEIVDNFSFTVYSGDNEVPVPEPGSLLLLGSLLASGVYLKRRRRG